MRLYEVKTDYARLLNTVSNPFITPMVMSMAWGVLFGMFISLLLLPCLFMINDDLHGYLSGFTGKFKTSVQNQLPT